MKTVMSIMAELKGEQTQAKDGTFWWAFPYPAPVRWVVEVPEPYQAGPEVELPTDGRIRNTVAGSFPPGRWHHEGYRGRVQIW